MYSGWFLYGCIILTLILALCIGGYIFWHMGFSQGYKEGRAITMRQRRRQRNFNRRRIRGV